jgi:hypothetical protein
MNSLKQPLKGGLLLKDNYCFRRIHNACNQADPHTVDTDHLFINKSKGCLALPEAFLHKGATRALPIPLGR